MALSSTDVAAKKLVFVTGKGGIGKTAVAGALGAWAASKGRNTLLVESSHRDQIAPLFGHEPVGHHETRLADHLACVNLDAAENFREYVTKYLGQQRLYDTVISHRVVNTFFSTIPGFAEIIMLGRLFYTCELAPVPRRDLLVFDGYASGHFLNLMTTPDAILATRLGGPLIKESQRILDFLRTPSKVGVIYVVNAEPLVVAEALDFLPRLHAKSPAKLMAVVVNRSWGDVQVAAEAPPKTRAFLDSRRLRADEAMDILAQGWQRLPSDLQQLPVVHLRDYGSLPEPLTVEFATTWLGDLFAGRT